MAVGLGILGIGCACALWTNDASAEPTTGERATARMWMANGRMLRSQGNLESALQSFKTAENIMHVPTTGLEVARTLDAMGRLVEAEVVLQRVLALPVSANDPAPFQEALGAAKVLSTELEQRIPVVTFVLPATSAHDSLKVLVDGRSVPARALRAPLKLDPGLHRITARLGAADASQSIDLHERSRQPIVVRAPALGMVSTAMDERSTSPWRTVAYVSFGTSAAALVFGTIAGTLALSTQPSLSEERCGVGGCPASATAAMDRSHRYATASAVGFATCGAALGVGFMSLALAPTVEIGSSSSLRIRPRIGMGSAQIEGTF
jgi:hypothetical protein